MNQVEYFMLIKISMSVRHKEGVETLNCHQETDCREVREEETGFTYRRTQGLSVYS